MDYSTILATTATSGALKKSVQKTTKACHKGQKKLARFLNLILPKFPNKKGGRQQFILLFVMFSTPILY